VTPEIEGVRTLHRVNADDIIRVTEERTGHGGVIFLKIEDNKGWLFDNKPGIGVMCVRQEAKDSQADMTQLPLPSAVEEEEPCFELFFDADYNTVDHNSFTASLRDELRTRGFTDDDIAQMDIQLRPGSIVVKIKVPAALLAQLKATPLENLEVAGYKAAFSREALQESRSSRESSQAQSQARSMEKTRQPLEQAGTLPHSDSLEKMMLQLGDGSMRRPTGDELRDMALRIAEMRSMTEEQEAEVQGMLNDIADAMFEGWDGTMRSQPRAATLRDRTQLHPEAAAAASTLTTLADHTMLRKPTAADLDAMASKIGKRCDPDQLPAVRSMLRVMAEVFFGPHDCMGGSSLDIPQPSPRTCEDIVQRVLARSGGAAHEEQVRQMLSGLTEALFGRHPVAYCDSDAGSSLFTARSSAVHSSSRPGSAAVRPGSATRPAELMASMGMHATGPDDEVHGILTQLCGVLMEEEQPQQQL